MTPTIPERDPIKSYARRKRLKEYFPENGCCSLCSENRLGALVRGSNPIICFRCKQKREGKTGKEKHHVSGRTNHPGTIEVDINDHRAVLSPAQYDWPIDTLRNPNGSPLRAGAASIRGVVDWILFVIQTFLLWVADLLEALDEHLKGKLGPNWWYDTTIAIFVSRRLPNA